MKKLTFYPLVLMALLFSACEKADFDISGYNFGGSGPLNVGSVNFHSDALAIVQLPANRSFIYKDSATGTLDSVIVGMSSINSTLHYATSTTPGWFYDTYSLILEKITPSGYTSWFRGTATCDAQALTTGAYIDSTFSLSNEETGLPGFWYPLNSTGLNQYQLIPSFTVEGKTYSQVHKFSSSNGIPPSNAAYSATVFYWVKGIGIIKRESRYFNYVMTSLLVRYN